MTQTNDWISFSIFCPQKEWPRLLYKLDAFLSTDYTRNFFEGRLIEFNHLYGSNIRLFILPVAGKNLFLTEQIQTFFSDILQVRDNLSIQAVPGIHAKIPTGNASALAIRLLLSNVIIAAFKTEPMNDDTLFTMALYLHLALLKKNKAALDIIQSYAGTAIMMDDPAITMDMFEAEYSANKELLYELKSDVFRNSHTDLPDWLPEWTAGYETITEAAPEHTLPAIYRCTAYLINKQLALTGPLIKRLEYFVKKMAVAEIMYP